MAPTSQKTIEAIYCVPDEVPVVQVFLAGTGPQIAEISAVDGRIVIELLQHGQGTYPLIPVDELEAVFRIARERLL
ncbi:MAG: hypothetical protein R3B84_23135 [Zavarzinella sp.]